MATYPMANPVNPTQQQPLSASNDPMIPADNPDRYVQGYPRLAYFFSQCPRYLHLRRFAALSIRVQLFRQHELAMMEMELLKLEEEDSRADEAYLCDYMHLERDPQGNTLQEMSKQRKLYERIETTLNEYEESMIRSTILASRGWDDVSLENIQQFLTSPKGCHLSLNGIDADIWGSVKNPSDHATDIIQVFPEVESSAVGKFLTQRFSKWALKFPRWLQFLFFWSKKQPDLFDLYSYSALAFENASFAIGNIVTSLLVYGAVTLLYLFTGKTMKVVTVIIVAVVVTICILLFRNQQFAVMIGTVCAVLATLLANNSG